jgi:hypothetical protein
LILARPILRSRSREFQTATYLSYGRSVAVSCGLIIVGGHFGALFGSLHN